MTNEEMIEFLKGQRDTFNELSSGKPKFQQIINHLQQPANNAELVEKLILVRDKQDKQDISNGANYVQGMLFTLNRTIAALSAAPSDIELKLDWYMTAYEELKAKPANNAELSHGQSTRISALIELRDWANAIGEPHIKVKFGVMDEIIAALSAAPGVDESRVLGDRINELTAQLSKATQPAKPSALADACDAHLKLLDGHVWLQADSKSKELMRKAAQALRQQPFDVLKYWKSKRSFIIGGRTLPNMWDGEQFLVRTSEHHWNLVHETEVEGLLYEIITEGIKPYTAPEVLEKKVLVECDCDIAFQCPQGKKGMLDKCKIWKLEGGA